MELTELQQDAITELINIGFSRAAASLSDLTGRRIDLEVPDVSMHLISTVASSLGRFVKGEDVASVHQVFTGPVAGDAFLLLSFDEAVQLVEMLTGEDGHSSRGLGASEREVVTEIGNILMNACLGVFGNLLQVQFSFSVPRLNLDDLGAMIGSLKIESDTLQHALVVGARFRLQQSEVTGCLVLVLGIASFQMFLQEVEAWAERSVKGGGA